jgi:hypothetical protein
MIFIIGYRKQPKIQNKQKIDDINVLLGSKLSLSCFGIKALF